MHRPTAGKVSRNLQEMTTPKSVQPVQNTVPESAMNIEPTASLDGAIQGALGRKLRESWEEVVREEVPEKFKNLLEQLKKTETEPSSKGELAQGDQERKV